MRKRVSRYSLSRKFPLPSISLFLRRITSQRPPPHVRIARKTSVLPRESFPYPVRPQGVGRSLTRCGRETKKSRNRAKSPRSHNPANAGLSARPEKRRTRPAVATPRNTAIYWAKTKKGRHEHHADLFFTSGSENRFMSQRSCGRATRVKAFLDSLRG
ncbi:hypothetical protein Pla100_03310 [Neorhodopirellula pilleata]|uniref:Uncharacterized protein n=1 Tax=Neorhodopirellula pilleata TaxID=2714738 RepID=A0A5C6AUJ9_9BACT|nr:hypothetical protein Pla100_03310 [Neorhodopirellula pilleata]